MLTAVLAIGCLNSRAQQRDVLIIETADSAIFRIDVDDIRRITFESVTVNPFDSENSYFNPAPKPSWEMDMRGNDEAPEWEAPDPTKFESSMFIMVRLQDELAAHSSDDDRMAVFIGDECRTVPAVRNVVESDSSVYFVMKIRGNSSDRNVIFSLRYYCANLHRIFSLMGQESFATERTYGYDEDFTPPLLRSLTQYPVQNSLTANLPANAPFEATGKDMVGVFVGNECRGVGKPGKAFTVCRTNAEEKLQLRYYSEKKGGVFTFKNTFSINEKENLVLMLTF